MQFSDLIKFLLVFSMHFMVARATFPCPNTKYAYCVVQSSTLTTVQFTFGTAIQPMGSKGAWDCSNSKLVGKHQNACCRGAVGLNNPRPNNQPLVIPLAQFDDKFHCDIIENTA
ncbi:hypothetical protein Pst134EA_011940 [Puccinia striiformis f. sp. tritici]|uniref:hypothetical protein n=1 Tax=Puccinia striiformis f. sp. tritici TaxID=168172 RepID=UPI0020074EDA|nr:hypothetical protein Pst134EA_011940 [Puccinia striiformis f. sp. tritici]KAH9456688.1 hypothetical protein Pst134EB_012893 [Puccinia striiformis f. sp. tritici]KAH9468317.1 hypothetical protein Pst134EA_011940 [Puccinia striiformis f. sp. tritici]KAI9619494.1 hypothetical protein H4Q26_014257 [Puccinia striiformis f. sp. tritici PST-130]KAI9631153.1 hypothetical protein KEM48_013214 [Puccinia striiformis f. sp. tritici PST-130]